MRVLVVLLLLTSSASAAPMTFACKNIASPGDLSEDHLAKGIEDIDQVVLDPEIGGFTERVARTIGTENPREWSYKKGDEGYVSLIERRSESTVGFNMSAAYVVFPFMADSWTFDYTEPTKTLDFAMVRSFVGGAFYFRWTCTL